MSAGTGKNTSALHTSSLQESFLALQSGETSSPRQEDMRSGVRGFKSSSLMSVTVRSIGTLAVLLCCYTAVCMAQKSASPSKTQPAIHAATDNESLVEVIDVDPGAVVIEGRHILNVYESIAGISPQERADRIADRIIA